MSSRKGTKSGVKGCKCKRTKCIKNFCDCYKNSKLCGKLCKCIDCQNVQANNISVPNESEHVLVDSNPELNTKQIGHSSIIVEEDPPVDYTIVLNKPFKILTSDIVNSTIECLIECAIECQQNGCNAATSENMVLEEFGRCLEEIIKTKE